jgi:ABC-type Zn2+ transport system substrate-binding protein/surface adhesin
MMMKVKMMVMMNIYVDDIYDNDDCHCHVYHDDDCHYHVDHDDDDDHHHHDYIVVLRIYLTQPIIA